MLASAGLGGTTADRESVGLYEVHIAFLSCNKLVYRGPFSIVHLPAQCPKVCDAMSERRSRELRSHVKFCSSKAEQFTQCFRTTTSAQWHAHTTAELDGRVAQQVASILGCTECLFRAMWRPLVCDQMGGTELDMED